MEIQGRIKTIFATETVGQNGFQKRDLVITTDGNIHKILSFNLHKAIALY